MIYFLILCAAWLGFANPVLQVPFLVILWPVGLVYLALNAQGTGQAFKRGWLAGSLVFAACLYWVAHPVHNFTAVPWILSLPVPVLLGIYLGLYPALFSLAVFWAKTRLSWFGLGIFAALVWICLEYIRASLFTGFPWLSLPQALAPFPWSLKLLSVIGSFYLAGLMVLVGTWFALGFKYKKAFLAALLLVLVWLGYPAWFAVEDNAASESQVNSIGLIQGNIDQDRKWDPEYQRMTVQKYKDLSTQILQKKEPDLLIWPETAMPFYLQEPTELQQMVKNFVREKGVYLITGAPGYSLLDSEQYNLYNRAYLLKPAGRIADHYDKERLVPFGEYVPLQDLLPIGRLVSGARDFSPGSVINPLQIKDLALGTLICYEIIFPELGQKRVEQGANILLNISNDAWFGKTSAPRQHLNQAVLRALEQNRWILRSTNTGISAFVSPWGEVKKETSLFEDGFLINEEFTINTAQTFFSRHYFYLKIAAWIGLAALILFALNKGRQSKQRPRFKAR